ncbi:unnamed protein product [Calypogeia fissa]
MSSSWFLQPVFFDPRGPLPLEACPPLNAGDQALWNDELNLYKTLSIVLATQGVARQSMLAKTRYNAWDELEGKYPDWMFIRVLMAEVHYLMNDTHVKELEAIIEEEEKEEGGGENAPDEEGWQVSRYVHPADFKAAPVSWSVDEIEILWHSLQMQLTEKTAMEEFARHAAIASNVLEGVFALEGRSWPLLVKRGFYMNSIEGISRTSRILQKKKIVDILGNTNACLNFLKPTILDSARYDDKMIRNIHSLLLKGDNVNEEEDEDGEKWVSYVARGEYRRVACFASHPSRKIESRFCPWLLIEKEMDWYIQEARKLLESSAVDPFLACAWLQRTFLRIHPFADGNGRVARIISSVPLLKAGLPPVFVSSARKASYFEKLIEADKTESILPLASYLKEEMGLAITEVSEMA